MQSRVYASVGRPFICVSVCPIQLTLAAAAGLLLWARQTGEISVDCCKVGRLVVNSKADVGSALLSADRSQ